MIDQLHRCRTALHFVDLGGIGISATDDFLYPGFQAVVNSLRFIAPAMRALPLEGMEMAGQGAGCGAVSGLLAPGLNLLVEAANQLQCLLQEDGQQLVVQLIP